jgi:hypothetical protein
VEVCQVDAATAGKSVGKVRSVLLKSSPPYTPEEVVLFKQWWWAGGYRKRPPRIWDLQEQIGVIRREKPKPAGEGVLSETAWEARRVEVKAAREKHEAALKAKEAAS